MLGAIPTCHAPLVSLVIARLLLTVFGLSAQNYMINNVFLVQVLQAAMSVAYTYTKTLFEFFNYYGSSPYPVLTTTQVFRDPSAWYHLVIVADTTNSTQGDRLRMYVNGERVTSFSQEVYPSLNYELCYKRKWHFTPYWA